MSKFQAIALLLAVAGLLPTGRAAGKVVVVKEVKDSGERVSVFQMSVTPAPEPEPALRERLVLREQELKPGNAATHYLRGLTDDMLSGRLKKLREKYGEAFDTWYGNTPIEELPLEDVRDASAEFDEMVKHFVRRGCERRTCDWGYNFEELRGADVFSFLLPDLQQLRSVSRVMALRTRLAIADGRYADAIDNMRINYRLGCDVAQGETLVNGLVGIAICGVTDGTVIDLMGAPDSPNMYWALTELPRPMIDLRPALRLEMSMASRLVPTLAEAETAEHSPEEWARLLSESVNEVMTLVGNGYSDDVDIRRRLLVRLANTGLAVVAYPGAKERLIAGGMAPERVERMAVGQVILIDTGREWQRIADGMEKWWYIPYPEARKRMEVAEHELLGDADKTNYGEVMASMLLPALQAARGAQERLEWQIGGLRVVEALRMHAAAEGQWPESLDEVDCVPVPLNSVTGKPYVYRLEGDTAIVELPLSDGFNFGWRFELKLESE